MSELPDYVNKILDDFRQTLESKIAEVRLALTDLNTLERRYGLEVTTLSEPMALMLDSEAIALENKNRLSASAPAAKPATIATGTFIGVEPLHAAKRYIDMVRRAVDFAEIVDAITKGNAAIPQGSAWRDDLQLRLSRSPDVLKVADQTYGLTKHYTDEQVEMARKARRPVTPNKTKRKVKVKGKRGRKAQSKPPTTPPTTENKRPELRLIEPSPPTQNVAGGSGTES